MNTLTLNGLSINKKKLVNVEKQQSKVPDDVDKLKYMMPLKKNGDSLNQFDILKTLCATHSLALRVSCASDLVCNHVLFGPYYLKR